MPNKRGKPYSKKVKRRAPIRQGFFDMYVNGKSKVHAVQFSHRDNIDVLVVTMDANCMDPVPNEYKGYPVIVRYGSAN